MAAARLVVAMMVGEVARTASGASPGGNVGAVSTTAASDAVLTLLPAASLASLRAEGVETACDLQYLTDEELRRTGLNTVQLRKLHAGLQGLQRAGMCGAGAATIHQTQQVAGGTLDQVKTFGCIHSEPFAVTRDEFTICEHSSQTPGAITHMQFTWSGNAAEVHFRAYIDGETSPSIDVQMEQGMFAVENPQIPEPTAARIKVPWGNERIGRGGEKGGRYFNFKVPFQSHIRLALYSNSTANTTDTHCFTIIRGAEGVSATAGGLQLPPTARLKVYTEWAALVPKYGQLVALNTSGASTRCLASTAELIVATCT